MFPFGDCGRHGKALALLAMLALAALTLSSAAGVAASTARPSNTAEPVISGSAEQGRTLSASRGRWTGTGTISYAYRWVRCGPEGGRPDASNCELGIAQPSGTNRGSDACSSKSSIKLDTATWVGSGGGRLIAGTGSATGAFAT